MFVFFNHFCELRYNILINHHFLYRSSQKNQYTENKSDWIANLLLVGSFCKSLQLSIAAPTIFGESFFSFYAHSKQKARSYTLVALLEVVDELHRCRVNCARGKSRAMSTKAYFNFSIVIFLADRVMPQPMFSLEMAMRPFIEFSTTERRESKAW